VRDGHRAPALGGRKQRTPARDPATAWNEVVSTDRLIDGLWGERAPKTAGAALQVYVSNLRKLLSPERLEPHRPGYLLHVEPGELDLPTSSASPPGATRGTRLAIHELDDVSIARPAKGVGGDLSNQAARSWRHRMRSFRAGTRQA
jgi:hypothetical protein